MIAEITGYTVCLMLDCDVLLCVGMALLDLVLWDMKWYVTF